MRIARSRHLAGLIGLTAIVTSLALPALALPAAAQSARVAAARPVYQLWSVSCPAARECVAVGGEDTVLNGEALVRVWNGESWTARHVEAGNTLFAVSCKYERQCTAVGRTTALQAAALRWNGTTWREQRSAAKAGPSSSLLSVACPAATACFAVGSAVTDDLAERWNGTGWFVQALPAAADSRGEGQDAVSCSSAANCMALGEDDTGQDEHQPLAYHWDGTAWTPQVLPAVTDTAALDSVSCPNSGVCVAVGNSPIDEAGPPEPLAAAWSTAGWTLLPTAPHPDAYATLTGVSCTSARFCIAVGVACTSSGDGCLITGATGFRALALRWNGRKWTTLSTPTPAGTFLKSVSCSSWRGCTAVGRAGSALVAERWNGTRWTRQLVPGV